MISLLCICIHSVHLMRLELRSSVSLLSKGLIFPLKVYFSFQDSMSSGVQQYFFVKHFVGTFLYCLEPGRACQLTYIRVDLKAVVLFVFSLLQFLEFWEIWSFGRFLQCFYQNFISEFCAVSIFVDGKHWKVANIFEKKNFGTV